MIHEGCRWGILYGGTEFRVVHLKMANVGGDMYNQLVVSPSFHAIGTPSAPNMIQIIIAMLLGFEPGVATNGYTPPQIAVKTPYISYLRPSTQKKHVDSASNRISGTHSGKQRRGRRHSQAPYEYIDVSLGFINL